MHSVYFGFLNVAVSCLISGVQRYRDRLSQKLVKTLKNFVLVDFVNYSAVEVLIVGVVAWLTSVSRSRARMKNLLWRIFAEIVRPWFPRAEGYSILQHTSTI
jgi:hypothetical protein